MYLVTGKILQLRKDLIEVSDVGCHLDTCRMVFQTENNQFKTPKMQVCLSCLRDSKGMSGTRIA